MATERITIIDFTQGDEPVITYRDEPIRQPLGDITHQRRGRRRARPVEENHDSENEENIDSSTRNRVRGRRQRRRPEPQIDLQQGIGVKSSNPWIQHVKSFAKQHGITYWKALKSPQCKSSYK